MQEILDRDAVARGLRRVAGEIVERHRGVEQLLLVGIRRGGVPVARALARWLLDLEGYDVPVGSVDITLYRDDAATALPNPRIGASEIPGGVDGRHVILVDDVIQSGRTIRAAIDALMDYGRPRRIELATVVDRGGRELPIQPNFVLRSIEVPANERVDLLEEPGGLRVVIQPLTAPSTYPARP
ncbi:MAG: bifunctional pyr operon transcriptional regulator/uracil phosphoribosyltransferase PyrR [Polyangiaceae bacterium]|nr:bifunctional pyr operon transcriptional regulator/uracil phosphoribosyltransferase PyrR [Polyangiaceae bacterium]